jgi:Ca-activated chloride channel homolog
MMLSFGNFALLSPLWLCAIPLILACAFFAGMRAGSIHAWRRAIDPHLVDAMARRGGVLAGAAKRNLAAIVAAVVIALSLARPAFERADAGAFRNLDATLILADLSEATADAGRLEQLRIVGRTLAANTGTRQVGLIVYAGDAYLANALTTDSDALGVTIFALQPDTVPDLGDRPDRALSFARRTLRDAGVVAADVVLVSAGATVDGAVAQEATELRRSGYRLHTVAVAPPKKSAVDFERSAALAVLAAEGGGRAAAGDDLNGLTAYLAARPVERLAASDYAPLVWSDVGRLLLMIAAAVTLTLFRRRST